MITVPAYSTNRAAGDLKTPKYLAGWIKLDIINEPTAAATRSASSRAS